MFALYKLVHVKGGDRRRLRFKSFYDTEVDLISALEDIDDLSDYKVDILTGEEGVSRVDAKRFKEILTRRSLNELGYPRHAYTGILFNGTTFETVNDVGYDYVIPEGCTFGLVSIRFSVDDDGLVGMSAVNARIADQESIVRTMQRELDKIEMASGDLSSDGEISVKDIDDESVQDIDDESLQDIGKQVEGFIEGYVDEQVL